MSEDMSDDATEYPDEFLKNRILEQFFQLFRTRYVSIAATACLAFLPVGLVNLGIHAAWRFGVLVHPQIQDVLGFSLGFLAMTIGSYSVIHQLAIYQENSLGNVTQSLRTGLGNLLRILDLWLRVIGGVILGLLLLVIPGIRRMCSWYVALPALVVEQGDAGQSIQRSNELTTGHRWTILTFLIVGNVLSWLIDAAATAFRVRYLESRFILGFFVTWCGMVLTCSILAVLAYATYKELRSAHQRRIRIEPTETSTAP